MNPVSENLYITSTWYWVAITGDGGSMYQSSLVPRPLPRGEEGPGDEASTRGNIQSSAELKASLQSHSCVWLMHPCIVILQTVQCQLSYSHAHFVYPWLHSFLVSCSQILTRLTLSPHTCTNMATCRINIFMDQYLQQ